MQKWANKNGFTIVELLIVVVVIAILAAITIIGYNGIQNRARVSAVEAAASQASKKIATYAITNSDSLPSDLATIGLTNSGGSTYDYYAFNNASPKAFCVSSTNQNVSYAVTNSVLTPQAGRCVSNSVVNPSFETNTTGWTSAGSGVSNLTRVTAEKYTGNASLQIATSGTNTNQGAFTGSRAGIKPNIQYTASVWLKGDVGKVMRIELGEWDNTPALVGTRSASTTAVGTGAWQRFTVTRTMGATADTADITIRNTAAVAHTFYADSILLSEGDTQYLYSEGVLNGWGWSGTENNSTSIGPTNPL